VLAHSSQAARSARRHSTSSRDLPPVLHSQPRSPTGFQKSKVTSTSFTTTSDSFSFRPQTASRFTLHASDFRLATCFILQTAYSHSHRSAGRGCALSRASRVASSLSPLASAPIAIATAGNAACRKPGSSPCSRSPQSQPVPVLMFSSPASLTAAACGRGRPRTVSHRSHVVSYHCHQHQPLSPCSMAEHDRLRLQPDTFLGCLRCVVVAPAG
jgi:hypothetical protein